MKKIESTWYPERKLLVNSLSGTVDTGDVSQWKACVLREMAKIPDNSSFRMIDSLHGYEPADTEAHKAMRDFIPLTLADFDFQTTFVNLFEGAELPVRSTRGISCTAVAHVHHDENKMTKYRESIGRSNEQFFTDFAEAERWVERLK